MFTLMLVGSNHPTIKITEPSFCEDENGIILRGRLEDVIPYKADYEKRNPSFVYKICELNPVIQWYVEDG